MKRVFRYEAKFEIHGCRANKDVSLGGFRLKKSSGDERIIQGTYTFKCNPEKVDYIKEGKNRIEKFLTILIIGFSRGQFSDAEIKLENLRISSIEKKDLIKKYGTQEAIRYGLVERRGGTISFSTTPTITTNKSFRTIITSLKSVEGIPNSQDIFSILDYYRESFSHTKPYLRFLALWISFNMFYVKFGLGPKKSDRKNIIYVVDNFFDKSHYEAFVRKFGRKSEDFPNPLNLKLSLMGIKSPIDMLIEMNLKSAKHPNKYPHSQNLKKALKNRNFNPMEPNEFREIIRHVALCIYCIRNNLFHGLTKYGKQEDKIIVASYMLEDILSHILNVHLNNLGIKPK